ncbi:ArsR/SmtB family transcription factor [Rhizobium grahamii]|uniref:Transcriptional regulator n=1 Tax=Rhizobium grahamii TaxID=1120045 RepID=A0A370KI19_9HYPH|nr:metalloregulator ArsR/SmtB family transcription factor [Rhizobium grahamii]RDJ05540.1 transcriptional regulator [Rhizobium grahamii]
MSNDATFVEKAKLLALLANEKRLLIAYFISREEVSVGVLADRVGLSQSSLSQHLAKFREAKAVTTRRDAQTVYYSTSPEGIRRILETVDDLYKRAR